MNFYTKTVLYIYLERKKYEIKQHEDLVSFVGGVGVSLKLFSDLREQNPVIFSVGPLTGLFPFVSKTCAVFGTGGKVLESYIGGPLGSRIRFSGLDSIVFLGKSKKPINISIDDHNVNFIESELSNIGIPGRRSVVNFEKGSITSGYFTFGLKDPAIKLKSKGLMELAVSGSGSVTPKDKHVYEENYYKILKRSTDLTISKSMYPSCSSCPMGCNLSHKGEEGTEDAVLTHSLVGCGYAKRIYEEIPTVFSCLNSIGYSYTHEDLENLPVLVSNLRSTL